MYKSYISLMLKRREFIFSFIFMMLLSVAHFIFCCAKMYGTDIGQVLSADKLFIGRAYENDFYTILQFILPLIIVLPFCDIALQEEKNNSLPVILTRIKPLNLVFSHMLSAALGAFLVVFIPFFVNFILALIAFPINSTNTSIYIVDAISDVYYSEAIKNILFPELFLMNSYIYNFIFMILISVFCGITAALLYLISYYLRKNRVVFLFLAFIVNNFLIIFTNKTGVCIAPFEYLFAFSEVYVKISWYLPVLFLVIVASIMLLVPRCAKKLISLR